MKRLLGLLVSIAIMAIIFLKVDLSALAEHLSSLNPFWITVTFLFFIPQIMLTAWRWQWMIRRDQPCSLAESTQLILATSSLNVFMPSKLGDLCKAYYLSKSGQLDWRRGLNQVLFERFLDLWSLCWMGTFGVLFTGFWTHMGFLVLGLTAALTVVFLIILKLPMKHFKVPLLPEKLSLKIESFFQDAHHYVERLKSNPGDLGILFLSSMVLWGLHVIQFYFMALATQSSLGIGEIFAFIPVGILVGLLPFTVAGVGTRDAAFLYLFSSHETSSRIVLLGLFATIRYLVPGIAGIPFISRFFSASQIQAQAKNESAIA